MPQLTPEEFKALKVSIGGFKKEIMAKSFFKHIAPDIRASIQSKIAVITEETQKGRTNFDAILVANVVQSTGELVGWNDYAERLPKSFNQCLEILSSSK